MFGLDWKLIFAAAAMLGLVLLIIVASSKQGSLNGIKLQTVGNGQHGTARWATPAEIRRTYARVPFRPQKWRRGEDLPTAQGVVLGCIGGRPVKQHGKLYSRLSKLNKRKKKPCTNTPSIVSER